MQTLLNCTIPISLLMVICSGGLMLGHFFNMKSSKIKAPTELIPDETVLKKGINWLSKMRTLEPAIVMYF